ncbi:MAG: hypothetical protein ACD_79C01475G0001 [uncultured bacterium]|nr:MAG: hypothetical protein ACD_79C01475G0001 [uncultured bacterium]
MYKKYLIIVFISLVFNVSCMSTKEYWMLKDLEDNRSEWNEYNVKYKNIQIKYKLPFNKNKYSSSNKEIDDEWIDEFEKVGGNKVMLAGFYHDVMKGFPRFDFKIRPFRYFKELDKEYSDTPSLENFKKDHLLTLVSCIYDFKEIEFNNIKWLNIIFYDEEIEKKVIRAEVFRTPLNNKYYLSVSISFNHTKDLILNEKFIQTRRDLLLDVVKSIKITQLSHEEALDRNLVVN